MDYYADFKNIVAHLCTNRNNPELKCNGKCCLKDRLAKQEQEEQKKTTNIDLSLNLTFSMKAKVELPAFLEVRKTKKLFNQFKYHHFSSKWKRALLRPPIFFAV